MNQSNQHLPYTSNATKKRLVAEAFLSHANLRDGTYNRSGSPAILGKQCAVPEDHACSTRKECDKLYHGLNSHGRCPPPHGSDQQQQAADQKAGKAAGQPLFPGNKNKGEKPRPQQHQQHHQHQKNKMKKRA